MENNQAKLIMKFIHDEKRHFSVNSAAIASLDWDSDGQWVRIFLVNGQNFLTENKEVMRQLRAL